MLTPPHMSCPHMSCNIWGWSQFVRVTRVGFPVSCTDDWSQRRLLCYFFFSAQGLARFDQLLACPAKVMLLKNKRLGEGFERARCWQAGTVYRGSGTGRPKIPNPLGFTAWAHSGPFAMRRMPSRVVKDLQSEACSGEITGPWLSRFDVFDVCHSASCRWVPGCQPPERSHQIQKGSTRLR